MSGCDRYEWERVMRRAQIGSTTKYVGMVLAQYASRDGSDIRPGVARLAAVTELSERTVRGALGQLRDLGLIERTRVGSSLGRRALTDEHRLTIPADALTRIPMLDPDESPAAPAGDPSSASTEHRQLTHRSPAAHDRTPATDDRNTGSSCTPPNQDQPQNLTTHQRVPRLRSSLTTARDDEPNNVIPFDGRRAR